jgi:hypothetical protein
MCAEFRAKIVRLFFLFLKFLATTVLEYDILLGYKTYSHINNVIV